MNAERSTQGRPLLPRTAKCPGVWRQRAAQFDWIDRAEAWDQEQRWLSLEQVEQTLRIAQAITSKALYIQKDVMRGELKNPDGSLTEEQNCTQWRLATENILDRAGVVHDRSDGSEEDDLGNLPVTEIKISTSSEENIQIEEQISSQIDEGTQKSPTG